MPHVTLVSFLVLVFLAALFLVHALLPEMLFHWLHIKTFYKGLDTARALSLTFDDGPDERYTPAVLDILMKYDAKATFFLVAENALKHPKLVRRMVAEGHEIASHSSTHRHAWMQDPVSAFRDVRKSKRVLEDLTGQPIRFYRPPWGAFSLVLRLAIKAAGVQPVLWSGRAMDWLANQTSNAIRDNIVNSSRPGAIVLCHDAGGAEGAPTRTIAALPGAIETLQALQYNLQTVGEMYDVRVEGMRSYSKSSLYRSYPPPKRALISTWSLVERGFTLSYRVESLDEIFRFNRTLWSFGNREYPIGEHASAKRDETSKARQASAKRMDVSPSKPGSASSHFLMLRDGMPVLDLHFQNKTLMLLSHADNVQSLIGGLKQTRRGLRRLAALLQYHPAYRDIQAITGITLVYRGIEALGFHVEDLPSERQEHRLERYMRFLMAMYHPEGMKRLRQGRQALRVKHVWMAREELILRYGQNPSTHT